MKPNSSSNIKLPPSLAELEQGGHITRKREAVEVDVLTEQDTEDAKREYLFKFDLLRKSYKTATIPEFSIHSDYNTMKKTYETTLRMLTLDQTVDDYKRYMSMAFGGIEFVLGSVFNFDIAGYSTQQQLNMASYERMLVELGEKSYVPTGSKYPVEVRLLFMIVINTAFFLVTKIVMKKSGLVMNPIPQSQSQDTSPPQNIPKRKMRGPTINVNDIPDIDDNAQ